MQHIKGSVVTLLGCGLGKQWLGPHGQRSPHRSRRLVQLRAGMRYRYNNYRLTYTKLCGTKLQLYSTHERMLEHKGQLTD
eukprot:4452324-Amphidinium_carterae.1